MPTSDVRIWNGTSWDSLKGAQGEPGPQAVSSSSNNALRILGDGLIGFDASTILAPMQVRGSGGTAAALSITDASVVEIVGPSDGVGLQAKVPAVKMESKRASISYGGGPLAGGSKSFEATDTGLFIDGSKWPATKGGSGQFLVTNGSGELKWATSPSGSFVPQYYYGASVASGSGFYVGSHSSGSLSMLNVFGHLLVPYAAASDLGAYMIIEGLPFSPSAVTTEADEYVGFIPTQINITSFGNRLKTGSVDAYIESNGENISSTESLQVILDRLKITDDFVVTFNVSYMVDAISFA